MTKDKQAIAEQTIRWLLRQQEGMTASEQDAFQRWLQTPAHRAEYQDLTGLWQQTACIPVNKVSHLRAAPVRRRRWQPVIYGCALLTLAAVLWLPLRAELTAPLYSASWQTARGEIRNVSLPDGSKISLDAGTQLTVRYYASRREVEMPQGQAFFQVAHNLQRPFEVFSGPSRVTVVGTEFSVRYLPHTMSGDGTDVAVSSGAVRIGPRSRWQNGWWRAMQRLHLPQARVHLAVLHTSERATGDAEGRLRVRTTLPADSIATWRNNVIVLNNTRLDMALAEFARYGDVSVKADSPAVAALRVSGIFDNDRAESFAKSLPLVLPVKIKKAEKQSLIITSRAERKNN